jgi:transposase
LNPLLFVDLRRLILHLTIAFIYDIMFLLMYTIPSEMRLRIVHYYLNNGSTLEKTASQFHVNYRTVFKWVKLYKKEGEIRLLRKYRKPWNRSKKELEEKIALLKEKNPTLTIRKAQRILQSEGINISIKGIWGIWKRYGYAGFDKASLSTDFPSYTHKSPEIKEGLKNAEILLKQENVYLAAKVLNELPSCPKNKFLVNIPDRLLSPKRKLEKLYSLFGILPYPLLVKKLMGLRNTFEKRGFFYSALRAGLLEAVALSGSGKIRNELNLFLHLKQIASCEKLDISLKFSFYCIEGIAQLRNLKIKRAYNLLRKAELLTRKYPNNSSLQNLLVFYDNFGYFGKIANTLKTYEKRMEKDTYNFFKSRLYISQGEYKQYARFIRKLKRKSEVTKSLEILQKAQYLLLRRGEIAKSIAKINLFLQIVQKKTLRAYWDYAAFFLAGIYAARGEKDKAKHFLKKYLPLLRKFGNKRNTLFYEIILDRRKPLKDFERINHIRLFSLCRKASLTMKERDYRKALEFAKKEILLGIFHRLVLFFPEVVNKLLENGKETGLPKPILEFPVFNKRAPVYHLKILGNPIVYKNQRYLRTKAPPKDSAFLSNFALMAGEPGNSVPIVDIHNNFWKKNKYPSRNLSHLLVRIKKAFKIPSHLLEISYIGDYPYLINKGIHFTTDYDEFKHTINQAKALLRAGEWGFAKREFNRAFKLFRGEPFKRMYDDWSDDKRLKMLFGYETEILSFASQLINRKKRNEAKKLLKKASAIVPFSDEIRNLLNKQ